MSFRSTSQWKMDVKIKVEEEREEKINSEGIWREIMLERKKVMAEVNVGENRKRNETEYK